MRALRIFLFGVGFTAAAWGGGAAIHAALLAAGAEPVRTRLEIASFYREQVAAIRREGAEEAVRVVFLGDSMVVSYPLPLQIPSALQRELAARVGAGRDIRVFNLGLSGTGVFDYYFMADVIAAADPDLVVVAFNLASTSERFRRAFARPELAGWIDAARVPATALLPVSWVGLTFDRLLLYKAIVDVGAFDGWRRLAREQTRVDAARSALAERLAPRDAQDRTPESAFQARRNLWRAARNNLEGAPRYSARGVRQQLAGVLHGLPPDDPTVAMAGAVVRSFRGHGIQTLVYVSPINVDHVAKLGLLDEAGLARSLSSIAGVVRAGGGLFLDLHRLLPDAAFRDAPGHFVFEGGLDGPARLAAELAPAVLAAVRQGPR